MDRQGGSSRALSFTPGSEANIDVKFKETFVLFGDHNRDIPRLFSFKRQEPTASFFVLSKKGPCPLTVTIPPRNKVINSNLHNGSHQIPRKQSRSSSAQSTWRHLLCEQIKGTYQELESVITSSLKSI
jgi:hypothetical protein